MVPLSSGRLPDLSDEPNLPFTEAFTLEVMRYRTLVPLLQHATLRATEVDGCFIPENTSVRILSAQCVSSIGQIIKSVCVFVSE